MTELEKKLRMQNNKHEKDLKAIEEKYIEKMKSLTKKIEKYEDIIKNSNNTNITNNTNTNKLPEANNYATKYSHRGEITERLTDRTDRVKTIFI